MIEANKKKNKSRMLIVICTLLIMLILTVSINKLISVVQFNKGVYTGDRLKIAVIGTAPDIRESNIIFQEVSMSEVSDANDKSKFDAVLVMNDHLSEFGNGQYKDEIYNQEVPFAFVESNNAHLSFIYDIPYNAKKTNSQTPYITMLYTSEGKLSYWECHLYNDTKNKRNEMLAYSTLFHELEIRK